MSLSDPRLLEHDPVTGMTEWYHFDVHTGGFTIETQQTVAPITDRNVALWNDSEKHTRYGELTRIASIPNVIVMQLAQEGILSMTGVILDEPKYKRWLNDSANRMFRTRAGRV